MDGKIQLNPDLTGRDSYKLVLRDSLVNLYMMTHTGDQGLVLGMLPQKLADKQVLNFQFNNLFTIFPEQEFEVTCFLQGQPQ